eukprot:Skav214079  [mRNA]  locus=scaffold2927:48332:49987:+ [translate_table: standard]
MAPKKKPSAVKAKAKPVRKAKAKTKPAAKAASKKKGKHEKKSTEAKTAVEKELSSGLKQSQEEDPEAKKEMEKEPSSGLKQSQEEDMEEEEPQEEDVEVEPSPEEKGTERPGTRPRSEDSHKLPVGPETRPRQARAPGSLGALQLSTKQLLKHEQYLEAVEDLKQGKIQDHDFLALFNHKQRQGLFKHMEYHRSSAEASEWDGLDGHGARKKKQNLLLTFLKSGLEKSQVTVEDKVSQKFKDHKDLAWVSWKKITDEFGEEEARIRVKAGLVRMRKDPEAALKGLKIFQFLKVEEKMSSQKTTEQEMVNQAVGDTAPEVHQALGDAMRSLEHGSDSDMFFENMWLGKKPKGKTIQDFMPEREVQDMELDLEGQSEDELELFLAQTGQPSGSEPHRREGKGQKDPQADTEACKKANAGKEGAMTKAQAKAAAKEKREAEKKKKAEENKAKEEQKKKTWFAQVETLTSCEGNKAKRNLSRMSALAQREVRNAKVQLKRLGSHSGLEQSLKDLQETSAQVEEALVEDMDAEKVKELLLKGASHLKALKQILDQL